MILSHNMEIEKYKTLFHSDELSRFNGNRNLLVDYIFWLLLIIFANPGGIAEAFNAHYIVGKVQLNDILFVFLSICYFSIPKDSSILDSDFRKTRTYLLIFLIYYFVFHVYIAPQFNGIKSYSVMVSLIKSRHLVYYLALFLYIYQFSKRSLEIFLSLFVWSSITILLIFVLQMLFSFNFLPVYSINRGFVDIYRNLMVSDGFIPLLLPLGVTVLIFKFKIRLRNLILFAFALLPIYYIISLIRHDMLATFIYFFIAAILSAYITGRNALLFNRILIMLIIMVTVVITSYFMFPKYVDAARVSIIETFNVIETGKTSKGNKDERLGLDRAFIVNQFFNHPVWGTGFDTRWRGSGEEQGYESSDYPLLAAFAKYGITGVILFLPVYLLIFRLLRKDLRLLKEIKPDHSSSSYLFLVTMILFFVFHFLEYFNWLYAIAAPENFFYWYCFLSIYLASRHNFYFYDQKYIDACIQPLAVAELVSANKN